MTTGGKRSDGPFGWPIVGDDRVNAGLSECLMSHEPLNVQTTTDDDAIAMLFAQCRRCHRVYILDAMTFPRFPR
jgi:hypothetical protein